MKRKSILEKGTSNPINLPPLIYSSLYVGKTIENNIPIINKEFYKESEMPNKEEKLKNRSDDDERQCNHFY